MTAATLTHDTLLPRPPGGLAPGAALALLAHAGLLLALTYATDWRMQPSTVVSAELWAAVPQVAAPPPVPPPAAAPTPAPEPTPPVPAKVVPAPKPETQPQRDADIATERAEKRKAEAEQKLRADEARKARELKAQTERQAEATRQQKTEAERVAKAEQKRMEASRESARELLADEARLAELREANLRRMMGQAGPAGTAGTGNPGSRGSAAQDAAPSAAYSDGLRALIRRNTVFTGSVPDSAVAEVEVRAAASGTVLSRRLVKSSGHADWDEAVLRAVDRIPRMPRDNDGRVPQTIIIVSRRGD